MKTGAIPVLANAISLNVTELTIKHVSLDTAIIQLEGTLVREQSTNDHVVIALHAKNEAGQFIHLQQYEFEYLLDQATEKEINISVLVLSKLVKNQPYEVEIKLLTEQSKQQWHTVQHHIMQI